MATQKYIGTVYAAKKTSSRYRGHKIFEIAGIPTQETWRPPELPVTNRDKYYRLSPMIRWRLDILADYYYGDQNLWWVIAFANNIIDPFIDLNTPPDPPSMVRIPAPNMVYNKLST